MSPRTLYANNYNIHMVKIPNNSKHEYIMFPGMFTEQNVLLTHAYVIQRTQSKPLA